MDRLYEIMGELSEIEFGIESLSCVLGSLEEVYEMKHEYEMQKNVWVFKMLIDSVSENLSDKIDEIDRFLLDSKKHWLDCRVLKYLFLISNNNLECLLFVGTRLCYN